ncbi:MAG TPA: DUF979 domain-containing protein, partial [Gemmatimonadaceae bacterium]|nr:DUF979 domain-containing protein [Gemmatimonadaceae bacterium]
CAREAGGGRRGTAMITLEFIYVLMGILAAGVAIVNLTDRTNPRRVTTALLWGLYAVTFLLGSRLPDVVNGMLVIAMVLIASAGGLRQGTPSSSTPEERLASARRWKNLLFVPALAIPTVTLIGSFVLKKATIRGVAVVDPKQATQISLGLATLVGLAAAVVMLRPPPLTPIREARRLMDSVGWAAVLPQMLAALGAVFAAAGVGTVVSTLAERWIPLDHRIVVVATYTYGMALFTMVMGNAFAAFPVMTAGIGLPLIVHRFGGNPAIMASIGMVSGYCGTLMTPMAANFNIVPAALLELPDENAVIKRQIPTAIPLLVLNTGLMYALVFRF